jgi:hypothetical protein
MGKDEGHKNHCAYVEVRGLGSNVVERSYIPLFLPADYNMMKLGVKELIELCIYCWGHPLLYTCSGSVAVWMLLSGNLQHNTLRIGTKLPRHHRP